jgi:hypothetical protein
MPKPAPITIDFHAPNSTGPGYSYTFDPSVKVANMTLTDWTNQWWAWSDRLDPTNNPFTDTTGALAGQGNHGPVFNVAGSFSPVSVDPNGVYTFGAERSFDVPMGKPLLIPLINGSFCIPAVGGVTVAAAETRIDQFLDWQSSGVTDVFIKIDDHTILDENPQSFLNPVTHQSDYKQSTGYMESGFMSQGKLLPHSENTLGQANFGWTDLDNNQLDPTLYKNADLFPAKAAGWWALVDNLSPGTHTIEFGGTANNAIFPGGALGNFTFNLDVIDHITVAPGHAT